MKLHGARQLQARLTAIGQTRFLMEQVGLETVREAKQRVARRTATTARSIRMTERSDDHVTVTAGGAGPYLEFGTRPHVIRPRRAKRLRFPAPGVSTTLGGRVRTGEVRRLGRGAFVFARSVRHPGTRAQPFLIPGAKAAVATVGLDAVVERWNGAA